jgi:hypothetical protein
MPESTQRAKGREVPLIPRSVFLKPGELTLLKCTIKINKLMCSTYSLYHHPLPPNKTNLNQKINKFFIPIKPKKIKKLKFHVVYIIN